MEERTRKRARLDRVNDDSSLVDRPGHRFGDIYISGSGTTQIGDLINSTYQEPPSNTRHLDVDKYEVLLKSLLFDRIDARVHNVKKALSRTCTWLFQHENFKEWRNSCHISRHNGFLWIKGKPGCGKSTIMKSALEWTRKEIKKQGIEQTVVHYFFNARAPTSLEKSSLGFYRSLTYQLLCACPWLRSSFTTKFALKEPEQSEDAWTKAELQDFLCDIVTLAESSELCVFIDALDEGEQEDDVREMINFLVDLSERALLPDSSCQLRICLSSRHFPHISIKKGLAVVVEEQPEHSQDIDTYIRSKLFGSQSRDKDELSADICRRSGCIFLWVVLVVDMLNKLDDHGSLSTDMRARLSTIPSDLNKLFHEILVKSTDGVETSVALLQWILFAVRSLEPQELYLAVEYSRSPSDPTWSVPYDITVPSVDFLKRYVLNCSRGLVELTSTQPPIVQFIHETVREFLVNESGLASVLPALSNNLAGLSHEILKISCARYIARSEIPSDLVRYVSEGHTDPASFSRLREILRTQLPFIDYAASHLFAHAEQAQNRGISQETFLDNNAIVNGVWNSQERQWWNVLERFKARKHASDVTLLYFLADQGYSALLSTLLKSTNTINKSCGRYGCALQAACVGGHQQIVLTLIGAGADVNLPGGEHEHSLIAAVFSKNFAILPVLQQNGARAAPILLQKALFTMVARKSVDGVAVMLDLGADVNGSNSKKESPLYLAASKGYIGIVDLLLRKDANINAQGEDGNALQGASLRWHIQVVQMLLDRGADIDTHGGEYGNAVNAASAGNNEKIVQLLLDYSGTSDVEEGVCDSALYIASDRGHNSVVRTLLNRNANINARRGRYGNALQAASFRGHLQVVQTLLDRGADVNARGGEYGNSLQAASHRGHEKVVQMLLERGADANAQEGPYSNALQAASDGMSYEYRGVSEIHSAHEKIKNLLRNYGASS